MAISTIGTASIAALGYGFKNRLINGGMVIDQRNSGASITPTNGQYSVDRWTMLLSQASKYTAQQNAGSVTPPAGFTNYLGVTSSSAYSVLTADYFVIRQYIEGFNFADMAWGTASAATVTLSFWVRSSLTGTFGGAVQNSAANRSYPFTYTISAANTWEQKSVTIAGDTTGTWLTTNGVGLIVSFGLGVGSTYSGTAGSWQTPNYTSATGAVSVVGTSGATFYVTGVQLEKGTVATSFDWRPYGTELALCQRYYYKQIGSTAYPFFSTGYVHTSSRMFGIFNFPQMMRATPTLETTGTASNYQVLSSPATIAATGISLDGQTTNFSAFIIIDTAGGLTAGQGSIFRGNNTSTAYVAYSSEL